MLLESGGVMHIGKHGMTKSIKKSKGVLPADHRVDEQLSNEQTASRMTEALKRAFKMTPKPLKKTRAVVKQESAERSG